MTDNDIYYIYLLKNDKSNKTYVGCTNNLERRIKQHNSIISGGAKYTSQTNGGWYYIFYISGFPDKYNALSAEWKMKDIYRKKHKKGIHIRIESLIDFTFLNNWTSNCIINNNDLMYQISIHKNYLSLIQNKLNSNFIIEPIM